jgi:indolepyruvate ferredoxin oxidoreductase, beta subunit
MQENIILAGVGGQGILSIAYVVDNAALDAGLQFKQAEVHGMSQRGGAVQSHLRYSDQPIHSDLIPLGRADMVLSVEPLEVLRYWHYLAPDGWVVTSVTPYVNIPDYPPIDDLLEELATFANLVLVDAGQVARAAGNMRAQNMVVLGAASNQIELTEDQLLKHVETLFLRKGEKVVEVNRRAFSFGRAVGGFYRGLNDRGVGPLEALALCRRLDPASIDPVHAEAWASFAAAEPNKLREILAGDGAIACDQVTALA